MIRIPASLDRALQQSRVFDATKVIVVLPVILMTVSDFKFRQREITSALGGTPDLTVLIEVFVYGLAGLVLLREYILHPHRARVAAPLLALWGWGVTMMVSAFIAPYPVMASVRGSQLLVMCLLASMLSTLAGRKEVSDTAHVFLGVVTAAIAFGLLFPFPPVTRNTFDRFTWMFVPATMSGVYLALALVITLSFILRRAGSTRWPRLVYILLIVAFAVALYRNQSRGSLAGAAAGCIAVALLSSSRRGRPKRLLGVLAAVAGFVLAAGPAVLGYLSRGESTEKLGTLNERTRLWSEAWHFFSERPLSGWGLGSTRGLFIESIGLGGGHNAFVNVMVDGGIVGLFWWFTLLIVLIAGIRRLARIPGWREEVPLMAGILTTLIVNAVTVEGLGAASNSSSIWLCVLVGWVVAGRRSVLRPEPVEPEPVEPASRQPTAPPRPMSPAEK